MDGGCDGVHGSGVHALGVIGAGAYALHMPAQGAASSSVQIPSPVSLRQLLEVVAEFDRYGGASLGLVAWELCVEEQLVAAAWQRAARDGLIAPAGRDHQEQLWRLGPAGWAAAANAAAR